MSLADAGIVELHAELSAGKASVCEATQAVLERIAARDGEHRAFVTVLADQAMARARELDAARARDPASCGALFGVPVVLKDLVFTRGVRTTCGTRVLRDFVPDYDATIAARLHDAGAVVVGKVKLTEGAFSSHHPDVEPPRNPWHEAHWTGVSSSGSGVAVAARMAAGAIGTDTGGSIRFPSASCGVVGIKPTYGRVSRYGIFPLADSLDHVGPMARSVADAARMLTVLAGHDPADPTSLREPLGEVEEALNRSGRLRVGYDASYAETGVADDLVAAIRSLCEGLGRDDVEVVPVRLPECTELIRQWVVTTGAECALAHAEYFPRLAGDYGPELSSLINIGREASAMAYARLERRREAFRAGVEAVFGAERLAAIIAPAMRSAPPTWTDMAERGGGDDATAEFITFTAPWNYSGHPSVTVPIGLNASGLPLAVQAIAPLAREDLAVAVAARIERLSGPLPTPPRAI